MAKMAKLVLMDFYADWCGPCRTQGPIFEELAKELGDKAEFKKINVDKEGDLATEKGIFVVPTIILEKDGVELKKWMGVTSKEELTKAVNDALK
jgi:thioredoxin 1